MISKSRLMCWVFGLLGVLSVGCGEDSVGSDEDRRPEPVLCQADQRVEANQCVSCPAGTTRAAGDNASGADTTCDDVCSLALGVTCAQLNQTYLKASNPDEDDFFGHSVALEGDTLVVGALWGGGGAVGVGGDQLDDSVPDSGAVYMFERSGGSWRQSAYVKASNTGSGDQFGSNVALEGDTLAVGASREASGATGVDGNQLDNSADSSGAVYVYKVKP